jgi:hypothetical protein
MPDAADENDGESEAEAEEAEGASKKGSKKKGRKDVDARRETGAACGTPAVNKRKAAEINGAKEYVFV